MPVANSVPNADRYVDYNPTTPAEDTFAVTFAIWAGSLAEAKGDLEVRINGEPTTDFSVTGTLDTSATPHVILDASVVLDTGVTNSHVEIEGDAAVRRVHQYPEGQGVAPRYQNAILNFFGAAIRDIRQKVSRAIRVPYGEAPLELPDAATRAEGFIWFDADGNPTSVPSGNVETLANIADEIVTVAGIAPNVTTVAGISANVTAVAGISVEVPIVAGIAANVVTVAGIHADVTTVAGIAANVTTVAGIAANVTTVAGISADVTTVAGISGNVTTLAGISAELLDVWAVRASIVTVAGIDTEVATVAGISVNVTAVAGNAANINAVAANETNIDAVAGNAANINAVAGKETEITALGARTTEIDALYAQLPTITTKLNTDGANHMTGALDMTEIGAIPATPPAGRRKLYPTSTGWKTIDSAGVETDLGSSYDYATNAIVGAASIPSPVLFVRTAGYAAAGDGGGALYKRAALEPSHAGKIQSADGAWWEMQVDEVVPEMLGAGGDGAADDADAVENALAVAAALGVPLRLLKHYLVNGMTLMPGDGARIYGPGRLEKNVNEWTFDSSTSETGTGNYFSTDHFIRLTDVDNVHIEGVGFRNYNDASRRYAIIVDEGCTNVKLLNNRSVGTETFCFVWDGSQDIDIVGNRITTGGAFGIALGGTEAGTPGTVVKNVRITRNYIADQDSEAFDINMDVEQVVYEANVSFNNNLRNGEEDIDIGGGTCRDIKILNNIIDLNAKALRGIYVKSTASVVTTDVLISGNTILNGNSAGGTDNSAIYVLGEQTDRVNINDNETGTGFAHAVSIVDGPTQIEVVRNRLRGAAARGIYVFDAAANAPSEIKIIGNVIDGLGAGTGAGVDVVDGSKIIVAENSVLGWGGNGIAFAADAVDYSILGNDVTDCDLIGISCLGTRGLINANRVYACGREGVNLQADNLTCTANIIFNNSQSGAGTYYNLRLVAGSDFCVITGNRCFDSQGTKTAEGFRVTGASCDRCVVQGNIFYGNRSVEYTGTGNLTNSVFSTSENVVA